MTLSAVIHFILVAFINVWVIRGFYESTQFDFEVDELGMITDKPDPDSKMILWRVRAFALKAGWFGSPITLCPTCMASIHSIYVYLPFIGFDTLHPVQAAMKYATYIFLVAGGSAYLSKQFDHR